MAIYPDKKAGKLTGRFAVEVQLGGQRLRGRCDTLAEAKVLEAKLRLQFASGTAETAKRKFGKASRPTTLREAIRRAEPLLWANLASAEGNFQKLEAVLSITGDIPLDALDQEVMDDLLLELANGRSDATVNRYLSSLSVFLKWCEKREYRTTPLPSFEWRDEDEGRIRWLSLDEEEELLSTLRGDTALLVSAAIRTGMRRSELLTLDQGQIAPEWVHLWKTKNKTARSIPVDGQTRDALRYLVSTGMPSASKLRYEWELAREALGLKDDKEFVFHACRHTCATRMVQADVNLRVIQTFMGHKAIQTTLRYTHVNNALLSQALLKTASFHNHGASVRRVRIGAKSVGDCGEGLSQRQEGPSSPRPRAGVAKLVDAPDLGSGIENTVARGTVQRR